MDLQHKLYRTACCVLLGFVASMVVAIGTPFVKPQILELVCSSQGMARLVPMGDETPAPLSQMLDCPLCLTSDAPPVARNSPAVESHQPLAYRLQRIAQAHILSLTSALWPPRGPPPFS